MSQTQFRKFIQHEMKNVGKQDYIVIDDLRLPPCTSNGIFLFIYFYFISWQH